MEKIGLNHKPKRKPNGITKADKEARRMLIRHILSLREPFYVTDEYGKETGEDIAIDDSWNYADILWNDIQAEILKPKHPKS